MRTIPVICVSLAVVGASAGAQPTPEPPRIVLNQSVVGRTSPPSGPLNAFVGEKAATLPKGAEVEVLGRKTYGGFGGNNVWLQVRPSMTAASAPNASTVWIYGGKQSGTEVIPSGVGIYQPK